jgi:hypothetical protein
MKRYLLQLADSTWYKLTRLYNEINHQRRKAKQSRIHRAELIRFAIEYICDMPAEQFNEAYKSYQLANNQEIN